jgi:branched-chain amino acid transport system substrate-binding protein
MTKRTSFTRRTLGRAAIAGATLVAAPLPLRFANAQAPGNLKVAVLLPTSGL